MLTVKIGREEVTLDHQDEIMYNGSCFQLTTRINLTTGCSPVIAKRTAAKLIKDGLLVLDRKEKRACNVEIYKLA